MIDPAEFNGFALVFDRDGDPDFGDPERSAYYTLYAPDLSYCGTIRLEAEHVDRFKSLFRNPTQV